MTRNPRAQAAASAVEQVTRGEAEIFEAGSEEQSPEETAQRIKDLPESRLLLAIETSCDETGVAILRGERDVLANIISSQAHLHERYGGVVPEVASRAHVQAINPAIEDALRVADVTLWDLSVIAVTLGPGLIGSLVVGVSAAKALAAVLDIPLVGVNHLEAHLYANILEHEEASPPAIGLIVSGGHTVLVKMEAHGIYEVIGQTVDDAAGEAFDKVARFLGLGFPGGPEIEREAKGGDPEAIKFPRPMREGYDFSFSGLKTAVVNYVERARRAGKEPKVPDVCASFQEAVAEVLAEKTAGAAVEFGIPTIFLSGGVAANSRLRELMERKCLETEATLFSPSLEFCTDNAAMIACCGYHRYRRGIRAGLDVNPDPNLPIA